MSLFDSIYKTGSPTDADLAHLADWAESQMVGGTNSRWLDSLSLLQKGADTLLRRRAMSSDTPPASGK